MAEQSREFSLADLAPEPLTFRDSAFGGDGTRHDMHTYTMFSPTQIGTLRRLLKEMGQVEQSVKTLQADSDTPEEEVNAAGAQLVRAFDLFLQMVIPTLPAERLQKIPFIGKQRLVALWNEHLPIAQKEMLLDPLGQAAGRRTPRGKRSPSSATPTLA